MIAIEKPNIQELVKSLGKLDEISLLLIDSGAKLLVARQSMENGAQENRQIRMIDRGI